MLCHPNILRLEEMAIERSKGSGHYYVIEKVSDSIVGDGRKKATMYMVTPYMDHDLSGLLENPNVTFTEPQIKCYLLQLLEGLRYLHDVCKCDLRTHGLPHTHMPFIRTISCTEI